MPGARQFQRPTGTRDFYPADLLRRRYIERLWRDTSIRHGFEEIDGPTFEDSELYAVKSGEGILGELFQAFSGKSPEDVERVRSTGRGPYALRPEFTPTLARMYAARASSLPRPCKWFWMQSCFRAERPQRGRLREFLQWNCDVMGAREGGGAAEDAEVIAAAVGTLEAAGIDSRSVTVRLSDRQAVSRALRAAGVAESGVAAGLALLDRRGKLDEPEFVREARAIGLDSARLDAALRAEQDRVNAAIRAHEGGSSAAGDGLVGALAECGVLRWCEWDASIVRGLAYYTGTVFEVIAEGERALAGGGRYDGLIELFGGASTPAAGFGMGDVVLTNVMEDAGLMPDEAALREVLSRPGASLRPDVFVVGAGDGSGGSVRTVVSGLRRGVEAESWRGRGDRKPWDADRYAVPPLHARHSYKSTTNVGKLLKDASSQHARFAAIVEDSERATLKDLASGEEARGIALGEIGAEVAQRLAR